MSQDVQEYCLTHNINIIGEDEDKSAINENDDNIENHLRDMCIIDFSKNVDECDLENLQDCGK